ncbi:MAG: T9SS type A sorting domain-containing protein [Gemmatimonadetes bacterium]|nr:T9SS type A sorting domain-containing protein [Gemmatimonadota bacterium]
MPSYEPIATASINYTWDTCSSSTPTTPTGGNTGGSPATPTGGNTGGSPTTPTGGDTGGSTPTGGDTGGSTTTGGDTGGSTTAGGDTGGSDTIAEETLTDGAKILLTVEPTAISEDDGATDVVVTATLDGLDGQVFDDDVVVLLTFDEDINGDGAVNNDDKAAVLDTDYVTELRLLTIPPDSVSGTMTITITPINDKKVEGDETIRLRLARSYPNNQVTVQDAEGDDVELTVVPVNITLQDTGKSGASFFAADTTIDDQTYTAGAAIADLVLPEASDGTGELTYGVSALPAGLSFDAATRTLSGAPAAATDGAVTIVYTATDEDGTTDTLTFTITIAEAGAVVPVVPEEPEEPESPALAFAADAAINDQEYTAEWPMADLVLPEASGGTGELTYSVSALPTGLSFDAATRTLSGTPAAATDGAVTIVYTATDEEESTATLTFTITVNEKLDFSNLFELFGAGKVVPTASHGLAEIREFVVGQRVEGLVLPAASGGTAPFTYRLSPALPAGLTFDAVARTIAGTPLVAAETVYTYTITDANGATASLSLQTRPTAFFLANNFPNPFNPTTTIQYALPQAAHVELTVYNVLGQPMRTLVAQHQSAGRYAMEWDATDDGGQRMAAGLYFYRLQAGGEFVEVKKMLLLK